MERDSSDYFDPDETGRLRPVTEILDTGEFRAVPPKPDYSKVYPFVEQLRVGYSVSLSSPIDTSMSLNQPLTEGPSVTLLTQALTQDATTAAEIVQFLNTGSWYEDTYRLCETYEAQQGPQAANEVFRQIICTDGFALTLFAFDEPDRLAILELIRQVRQGSDDQARGVTLNETPFFSRFSEDFADYSLLTERTIGAKLDNVSIGTGLTAEANAEIMVAYRNFILVGTKDEPGILRSIITDFSREFGDQYDMALSQSIAVRDRGDERFVPSFDPVAEVLVMMLRNPEYRARIDRALDEYQQQNQAQWAAELSTQPSSSQPRTIVVGDGLIGGSLGSALASFGYETFVVTANTQVAAHLRGRGSFALNSTALVQDTKGAEIPFGPGSTTPTLMNLLQLNFPTPDQIDFDPQTVECEDGTTRVYSSFDAYAICVKLALLGSGCKVVCQTELNPDTCEYRELQRLVTITDQSGRQLLANRIAFATGPGPDSVKNIGTGEDQRTTRDLLQFSAFEIIGQLNRVRNILSQRPDIAQQLKSGTVSPEARVALQISLPRVLTLELMGELRNFWQTELAGLPELYPFESLLTKNVAVIGAGDSANVLLADLNADGFDRAYADGIDRSRQGITQYGAAKANRLRSRYREERSQLEANINFSVSLGKVFKINFTPSGSTVVSYQIQSDSSSVPITRSAEHDYTIVAVGLEADSAMTRLNEQLQIFRADDYPIGRINNSGTIWTLGTAATIPLSETSLKQQILAKAIGIPENSIAIWGVAPHVNRGTLLLLQSASSPRYEYSAIWARDAQTSAVYNLGVYQDLPKPGRKRAKRVS